MTKRIALFVFALCILCPSYTDAAIQHFKVPPFEHYKVSPGDSFWFIAKRYGLDYRELMRLNPEIEPRNMHVGEVIRLKESAEHHSTFEDKVVALVNQERAKRGLKALNHRADVKNVAHKKS